MTCAICNTTEKLGTDFNPVTDEPRGTVCFTCKVDIWSLQDSLANPNLDKIKSYLASY
jgi:hypothetical protein